jgi:hypothetical protein
MPVYTCPAGFRAALPPTNIPNKCLFALTHLIEIMPQAICPRDWQPALPQEPVFISPIWRLSQRTAHRLFDFTRQRPEYNNKIKSRFRLYTFGELADRHCQSYLGTRHTVPTSRNLWFNRLLFWARCDGNNCAHADAGRTVGVGQMCLIEV